MARGPAILRQVVAAHGDQVPELTSDQMQHIMFIIFEDVCDRMLAIWDTGQSTQSESVQGHGAPPELASDVNSSVNSADAMYQVPQREIDIQALRRGQDSTISQSAVLNPDGFELVPNESDFDPENFDFDFGFGFDVSV
jgi:hypothetical protein